MRNEADEIWDRLKYGALDLTTVIVTGDGVARHFNTVWVSDATVVRVTVDDVAKSQYRDFSIKGNDVSFRCPPADGSEIKIHAYWKNE